MTARSYSLKSMFVWIAFVALALGLVTSLARLWRAESRISLLESRFGVLRVDDPSEFHVVEAKQTQERSYQWQVHLPAGRRYSLHAARGKFPAGALSFAPPGSESAESMFGGLELFPTPGRDGCLVRFSIDRSSDSWQTLLGAEGSTSRKQQSAASFAWLENGSGMIWKSLGADGTESQTTNEPLVLLRLLESSPPAVAPGAPRPQVEGVVVWVEEL